MGIRGRPDSNTEEIERERERERGIENEIE